MRGLLGEEYPAFAQCYLTETPRPKGLRVNRLKADVEEFRKKAPFALKPIPWAEDGFFCPEEEKPGKHPWHEAGVYYLQEPSAMVPASLLQAQPGERILDLCAAPGGKTTQIASAMAGEGILISNEIHPERAGILSQNVERLGIRNCIVTNTDSETLAGRFPGYFDRILVDAPCSGEGMFRKEPAASAEWSVENVKMCAARQASILDNAAEMLREGGMLVYSTCTFAPEENEGTIGNFLMRHPDFHIEKVSPREGFRPGRPEWGSGVTAGLEKTVRIWPHVTEGEGHFAAVLKKGDSLRAPGSGKAKAFRENAKKGGPGERERRNLWEKFCSETFREMPLWLQEGRLTCRGEYLWLCPGEMPDLSGIRTLRPGLMLGEFRKNRFEPSHALAMALKPENMKLSVQFGCMSGEAARYLHGDTLRGETGLSSDAKGWVLVCVDGWSAGWGKLSGGVLKNHYPRGLRTGC